MRNNSAPACGVIAEVLGDWQQAFDDHRPAEIAALFTPDAQFQGISPRLRIGRAEIAGYYEDVADGARATVEVLHGMVLDDGLAAGFADVTFSALSGELFPVRLSVVAQRTAAGTWLIRQYHAAPR
ncbi:YybH family protein [Streptomyces sp. NPDC013457]|uniref:YybH family protein n=1 Tax=Streptomyces sp. NPDC013457 TaxID=3364866 RepID=UPI0036FFE77F